MIELFIGLYLFIGLGIHSMSEKKNNETPLILIANCLFWPLVIIVLNILYIFTGNRGGWK